MRDPLTDQRKDSKFGYSLEAAYFLAILKKIKYSEIYIIAQPNMYQHKTIRELQSKVGAHLYQDNAIGDWSFLVMAPILIGSFGTFSWMAAFLSEGNSIHLPYISSHERGSLWHPAEHLFIHNDPRIIYHDIVPNEPTHESASQVLERDTVFARAVRARVNPCPHL